MASIEKRERPDGDHRVRIYPGGLSGTHCVDCRQDLRDKANPGPCTWRRDGQQ